MDKTADVKCPKCNSNNCKVVKNNQSLGCQCNDCNELFIVPDTDGVPTSVSE